MQTSARLQALVSAQETIGAKLVRCGGSTRGFDYLRIGLAISVVLWHSLETSYADTTSGRVWQAGRGVISMILPMFFALSGFLVCGSLTRTRSTAVFVSHRFLRLIPALFVEIVLSSLILGPIMTTRPLEQYFGDPRFFQYYFNIIGYIHYYLPGVFADNPTIGIVNKSLWTIPYELECYLALVVISVVGLIRRPVLLLVLVAVLMIGLQAFVDATNSALLHGIGPPGRLLVVAFLAGVAVWLWKDKIALSLLGFVGALVLSVGLLSFPQTMFLAAAPVAYVTVYLGMTMPPHIPVLMDGDYSYGLYLFAYPLQQTYSALFPSMHHWWLNAEFAIICGLGYAFFSWNVIEKRVLSYRKPIGRWIEGALPSRRPRPAV